MYFERQDGTDCCLFSNEAATSSYSTAGVGAGLRASRAGLSLRFEFEGPPVVGQTLTVTVEAVFSVYNVTLQTLAQVLGARAIAELEVTQLTLIR